MKYIKKFNEGYQELSDKFSDIKQTNDSLIQINKEYLEKIMDVLVDIEDYQIKEGGLVKDIKSHNIIPNITHHSIFSFEYRIDFSKFHIFEDIFFKLMEMDIHIDYYSYHLYGFDEDEEITYARDKDKIEMLLKNGFYDPSRIELRFEFNCIFKLPKIRILKRED